MGKSLNIDSVCSLERERLPLQYRPPEQDRLRHRPRFLKAEGLQPAYTCRVPPRFTDIEGICTATCRSSWSNAAGEVLPFVHGIRLCQRGMYLDYPF